MKNDGERLHLDGSRARFHLPVTGESRDMHEAPSRGRRAPRASTSSSFMREGERRREEEEEEEEETCGRGRFRAPARFRGTRAPSLFSRSSGHPVHGPTTWRGDSATARAARCIPMQITLALGTRCNRRNFMLLRNPTCPPYILLPSVTRHPVPPLPAPPVAGQGTR